jgi:hypothetical protein
MISDVFGVTPYYQRSIQHFGVAVKLWTYIREVLGSNLTQNTGYLE